MDIRQEGSTLRASNPLKYIRQVVAASFGVTAESRAATVSAMLSASLAESVAYWFQLLLSMAIATLGLVLSSSGVVIAAMLIAPLMGPIVQFGMALAIGSPLLAIRSFTRALMSIGVVIASAALITLVLPFYEVTPEIAARTSPTVLDLIIAGCCALAGAYTTVRPGSDTTGTAAGTAIGIALVPPLCVIGFGLGSGQLHISSGASLLFTANLCAILLFAVLMFLALGFDRVDVAELETKSLGSAKEGRLTVLAAGRLKGLFGTRYSTVLRVLMPLILMLGVYVPLRQALEEVTWQVRVRSAIQRILQDSPITRDAVRSVVTIEQDKVKLRLVVVAEASEATRLQDDLRARIAAAAGVVPTVDLVTVPDFSALQAAANAWSRPAVPEVPSPPDLPQLRDRLAGLMRELWPTEAGGALLSWKIDLSREGEPGLEVVHLGVPLGAAAESLLSHALSAELGSRVKVIDLPLPAETQPLSQDDSEARWVALAGAVEAARAHRQVFLHLQHPEPSAARAGETTLESLIRQRLSVLPQERACISQGKEWTVRLALEGCPTPAESSDSPAPTEDGPAVPRSASTGDPAPAPR